MKPDEENGMSNLATMKPATEPAALPSVGEIINSAGRTTRSEISLLEEQRRMSVARRRQLAEREAQLRSELAAVEGDDAAETTRLEAINRLLRVRRHMLADLECEKF